MDGLIASETANVTLCDVQGTTDFDTIENAAFVGNIAKGGGYWEAVTKKFADSHHVDTFEELVAYTKEHPQELIIATSYGTTSEIQVISLIEDVGIDTAQRFPSARLGSARSRLLPGSWIFCGRVGKYFVACGGGRGDLPV